MDVPEARGIYVYSIENFSTIRALNLLWKSEKRSRFINSWIQTGMFDSHNARSSCYNEGEIKEMKETVAFQIYMDGLTPDHNLTSISLLLNHVFKDCFVQIADNVKITASTHTVSNTQSFENKAVKNIFIPASNSTSFLSLTLTVLIKYFHRYFIIKLQLLVKKRNEKLPNRLDLIQASLPFKSNLVKLITVARVLKYVNELNVQSREHCKTLLVETMR